MLRNILELLKKIINIFLKSKNIKQNNNIKQIEENKNNIDKEKEIKEEEQLYNIIKEKIKEKEEKQKEEKKYKKEIEEKIAENNNIDNKQEKDIQNKEIKQNNNTNNNNTENNTENKQKENKQEKESEAEMKIITDKKSPNFSSRNNTTIDTIIIHHTGGNDCAKTLRWFEMKESSVSAHYVIDRDGTIYQMVDEDKAAWHSGTSWLPQEHDANWNKGSVNPRSIGIELVNLGDGKTDFPQKQMDSLKKLVASLKQKYNIDNEHILGHREVAPGRKTDPADNFDWTGLR